MEALDAVLKFAGEHNYPTTNPRGIYTEYLQHEILRAIFSHTNKLSFIGGTALRIVFNVPRFSEDLDFDNFGITEKEFEDLTSKVKKDLEALGFIVEFRHVYKGAYHCYFRFSNILFDYGFSPHREEKILVRIDTVRQRFQTAQVSAVVNRYGLFFEILHNTPDILLSQKMAAALERKRRKGRDFFDITFLMSANKPNMKYLKFAIGIDDPKLLKEKLLARCAEVDFESLADEVKPFLFNPADINRVSKFEQYIRQWNPQA